MYNDYFKNIYSMSPKPLVSLFTVFLLVLSCSKKSIDVSAHYDYPVRCIGVELDGSVTLESFGKGRNYFDASEQAKKNAVHAVVFKGVKEGNGGCDRNPLLLTASAQSIYQDFFANFFKDGGAYKDFVSLKDERISNKRNRSARKSNQMQQRLVIVRVDRLALKKMLDNKNIN